eukprot:3123513-Amphidinium_carterae.1
MMGASQVLQRDTVVEFAGKLQPSSVSHATSVWLCPPITLTPCPGLPPGSKLHGYDGGDGASVVRLLAAGMLD